MTDASAKTYIGCISGTSVDGLDIAALQVSARDELLIGPAQTIALPAQLRQSLLVLGQPENDDLDELGHVDRALGEFIGTSVAGFANYHNLQPIAVGSHGQTVRHRPPPQDDPFTMQIGDANLIAEITGLTTVADFRRRDMAAGGQGAPLVPPFHQALFANRARRPVILNVGGISNVSILGTPPTGFDTGPGNCLLDSWCARHTGQPFDRDGNWAATGSVSEALLQQMLADPYFTLAPPKSSGREYFNLDWLGNFDTGALAPQDVQATLAEMTARCTNRCTHAVVDTLRRTDRLWRRAS